MCRWTMLPTPLPIPAKRDDPNPTLVARVRTYAHARARACTHAQWQARLLHMSIVERFNDPQKTQTYVIKFRTSVFVEFEIQ